MRLWWRVIWRACLAAVTGWAAAAEPPVRVGLLAESQPFHIWPAGAARPQGYDIELLARIARDGGLRFTYLRYERWDQLLKDLAAGQVDVVTAPPFDLVLSDTHLGDGRVDALLRFMREGVRPGVSLPPVICISADFEHADGARLLAAGAIDLLTKDSDVAAFAQRVLRAFADQHVA